MDLRLGANNHIEAGWAYVQPASRVETAHIEASASRAGGPISTCMTNHRP
jgi:hypothetical protein